MNALTRTAKSDTTMKDTDESVEFELVRVDESSTTHLEYCGESFSIISSFATPSFNPRKTVFGTPFVSKIS